MTEASRRPASPRARLVAELADTLDAMIDKPLIGVALFGAAQPAIGRYTIERRLGAGATAAVYAARDTTLDRLVALKIVVGRDAEGAWRSRSLEEARALARLSHPNVVAVHDVGEWRGHPFIAMELVEGGTLARWQAERRAWPELLRRYIAAGRGLEAAHSVGLVHRDFKPANVLVADSGRVVVSDFGLAAFVAPVARGMAAGSRPGVGTPAYLAPEQRLGAAPRPSADVYSFAVALCEAATGRHPALAPALDWHRELRGAGLPGRACAAIVRGMADDPDRRWPHMGPLLAALEAALPRSLQQGRRTSRVVLGLGLASAAVGIAVTGRGPAAGTGAAADGSAGGGEPHPAGARISTARELVGAAPTAAAALLREVPARGRDEDWSAAVRTVLMRPIARELRCLEQLPPRTPPSIAHGLLAAVDGRGRAIVCELAGEQVTPLAEAAICARVVDGEHVAVLAGTGELMVFARAAGWQVRRRIDAGRAAPGAPAGAERCELDLALLGPRILAVRDRAATWRILDLADPTSADLVELGDAGRRPFAIAPDRRRLLVLSKGNLESVPIGGDRGAPAAIVAPADNWALDAPRGVAAIIGGGDVALIDVRRGAAIRRGRIELGALPAALEVAPDGRVAAAATSRGTLAFWPLAGSEPPPPVESVGAMGIVQLAFNRAGTRIAWRGVSGAIGVRDVGRASGHELSAGDGAICSVGFAADDRVVAATCDGRTLAWELSAERSFVAGRHDLSRCRPVCDEDWRAIWFTGVSAGGEVIASAGGDGTVGIWPLGSEVPGSLARRLSTAPAPRAFATVFLGDRLLVGPRGGAAQLWDWRTGARLGELPGHETWVYAAVLARPAGGPATIVTGAKSGRLRFWSDGDYRLRAETKVTDVRNTRVNELAVSPAGRRVAAALELGEVAICDAATGRLLARAQAHRGWVHRVQFLDEETVLSAGDDGVVQRIDATSGAITASISAHGTTISDMARRGSSLLTASLDGTIRLWDLRDGSLVRTYVGHGRPVGVVRWHPDGTRFVSGAGDGRACVWRVEQETCSEWLIGHRGEVRSAQFIDEDRVVTAAIDGTVRVWRPLGAATADRLSAELDRRAPACLDEQQRVSYLREPAADAVARARACRTAAR